MESAPEGSDPERQLIGFARTESDGVFVAVIWDLCIHPDFRGRVLCLADDFASCEVDMQSVITLPTAVARPRGTYSTSLASRDEASHGCAVGPALRAAVLSYLQ
eukprot:scaffold220117_cov50-Prasinocladus_malaysianus.AAC.1